MLRDNIAATSLIFFFLKNLVSVKCYDKSNMNAFTLNLREIFDGVLFY